MNKNVLIIANKLTHPTDAGNKWWIISQAKLLSELGCNVHFLLIKDIPIKSGRELFNYSLAETKRHWGDKFHEFKVNYIQKYSWILRSFINDKFRNHYYSVDMYYPWGLASFVNNLNKQYDFEICIINYIYLSKLFNKISIPNKAVSTHDCLAYRDLIIGEPVESITASDEAKALQRCPNIFALQDTEANYFQILSPKSRIFRVYGQFNYHSQPIVGNHNILFLSGNNRFNINGIKWFLKEVFPLIKEKFNDAQLLIGGSICSKLENLLLPTGVKLFGFVDSIESFYSQGDIAINPVSQGTGLKIKTFESLSFDKITITHPHSKNGIFQKETAPILSSELPSDWVMFFDKFWNNKAMIIKHKQMNEKYFKELNDFIIKEYKSFINI